MPSMCKGYSLNDCRCVFSVTRPGMAAQSHDGSGKCVVCNVERLLDMCSKRPLYVVRLLKKLDQTYRVTALGRCSQAFQEMYNNKKTHFCIGACGESCIFSERRKCDDNKRGGRVRMRGRGDQCTFCNIPEFQKACCDPKSRLKLIRKLARCTENAVRSVVERRVPREHVIQFRTELRSIKRKRAFEQAVKELSHAGNEFGRSAASVSERRLDKQSQAAQHNLPIMFSDTIVWFNITIDFLIRLFGQN